MKTNTSAYSVFRLSTLIVLCVASAACTNRLADKRPLDVRTPAWSRGDVVPGYNPQVPDQDPISTPVEQRPDNSFYRPGSGQLIAGASPLQAQTTSGGDIKLNFENANLLEVVKVILGDMLNVSYVVDPRVQGAVTMQTSEPLPQSALIPTLEMLLRMNEAALVTDGSVYKVLPIANAASGIRSPQLGDSSLPLPRGYSVRVVPVKYVAANEMAQIIEPFIAGGTNLLRVDTQRNVLILAGSGEEMARLLETVRMFDVDRMKGMSVAMFTPDFVDAKTLGDELTKLLADAENGLMAGLVRFVTIERLNGLMVVTPRPEYLAQVRTWVDRLDRDSGSAGRRLFIYRVQNGKATELADVLNQLFESDKSSDTPAARLAPGLKPVTASSTPGETPDTAPSSPVTPSAGNTGDGLAISDVSEVRIIADEPNNALMILANAHEYRQILNAMKQLDVTPMQVLIDVTIAEVSLTDDLSFGVEWFFNNKVGVNGAQKTRGIGTLDFGNDGLNVASGFSYAINTGLTTKFVLNTLAEEGNISIISSPTLLVLNNQEASIKVGDEISVQTSSNVTDGGTSQSNFEYRDTGILLNVKPRVNAGGLVIIEVDQEVSNETSSVSSTNPNPNIQTRQIKSTVAVQSGDSIILGGLIQDNRTQNESGIPGLHKTPVLGALFGSKSDDQRRTELLIMITPRAILDRHSALRVTEDFRRQLNSLIPLAPEPETPDVTDKFSTGGDMESRSMSKPDTVTAPTTPATLPANSASQAPLGGNSVQIQSDSVCERFGPFATLQERDEVKATLGTRLQISEQQTVARAAESYHVRVPPQASSEIANQMVDRLREAGLNDLLIYDVGPLKNAISIGVYKSLTSAELVLGKAKKLEVPAELQTLAKSNEPRYWLVTRRTLDTSIPLAVKSNYETVNCSTMTRR